LGLPLGRRNAAIIAARTAAPALLPGPIAPRSRPEPPAKNSPLKALAPEIRGRALPERVLSLLEARARRGDDMLSSEEMGQLCRGTRDGITRSLRWLHKTGRIAYIHLPGTTRYTVTILRTR
jgi:hypothetical protein